MFEVLKVFDEAEKSFEVAFDWAVDCGFTDVFNPKGFTPPNGLKLLISRFQLRETLFPHLRLIGNSEAKYIPDEYMSPDLVEKDLGNLVSGHKEF